MMSPSYVLSEIMTTAEPKRNFFQMAIYNLFALYLGITPPAPGQELFYAAVLLGITLLLVTCGYFMIHFLMGQMLS
jgi:hypothetical protein